MDEGGVDLYEIIDQILIDSVTSKKKRVIDIIIYDLFF